MLYQGLGILCVVSIGFIAHRLGICLVRAVKLLLVGRASLLLAILFSGLWVACYIVLANINGWPQPFTRFSISALFIVGGFIFGVGASINQGCSVSTMHQFARGNLSMIFTMAGWFAGWCIWMSISMTGTFLIESQQLNYHRLDQLTPITTQLLVILSAAISLFMIVLFPKQRERWLGISLIGFLVSIMFYIEPMWAPSALVQDTGSAVFQGASFPSFYRFALVITLLFGMWCSVVLQKKIQIKRPTVHKIVRHGFAGILMGIGGAMALGGNDSQILMGIPTLSPGAIAAVIAMILGIVTEQFLYHRGTMFYQKR